MSASDVEMRNGRIASGEGFLSASFDEVVAELAG
jgi:hypothetical protein